MLGGVPSVSSFLTGHEQTALNRVYYFLFFGVLFASKGSKYSDRVLFVMEQYICLEHKNRKIRWHYVQYSMHLDFNHSRYYM